MQKIGEKVIPAINKTNKYQIEVCTIKKKISLLQSKQTDKFFIVKV